MNNVTCWMCGGKGVVVVCWDDLCRGGDHCMHGDGEAFCPECGGEGDLLEEDEDDDDVSR